MSAPLVWIGIPLAAAAILAVFYRRVRLAAWVASGLSATLAILAWRLEVGEAFSIGPIELNVAEQINILGRSITLENSDRPLILFIFLAAFIWFAAAYTSGVNRIFFPLGLAILALLIAAVAVDPFMYGALFIEIAVLLSVPLLNPPGTQTGEGVIRFMIFQTLGVPFILLAGWMLTGVEAGSASLATTTRAGVILGLGFAFLLAVFPFYTWIPLVASQSSPYASGFILFFLPTISLVFGITFFDNYVWLQSVSGLPTLLTILGIVMIVTGGVWALFEKHLMRIFGYAVILETGFSLVAAGIGIKTGFDDFAMLYLPRLIAFAVWALALACVSKVIHSLELNSITGLGRKTPLIGISLLTAHFSISALPLLAGFPVKVDILAKLAAENPAYAAWILFGLTGLFIGGLKTTFWLFSPEGSGSAVSLTRWQKVLLTAGSFALLAIGIVPQFFLPVVRDILLAFPNLGM